MKLKKLKLTALSEAGLKGGNCCRCSCYYEGKPGGAAWNDNMNANYSLDTESKQGCNQYADCEFPLDVDPDWVHE